MRLVDQMIWYHECSGLAHPWLMDRADAHIAIENFIHTHTCFQLQETKGIRVHFTSQLWTDSIQIFGSIQSRPHALHLHTTSTGTGVKFQTPHLDQASSLYRVDVSFTEDQFRPNLYQCHARTYFPDGVIFERLYRIRPHLLPRKYKPVWLEEGQRTAEELVADVVREQGLKGLQPEPDTRLREVSINSTRVQNAADPSKAHHDSDLMVRKSTTSVFDKISGQKQQAESSLRKTSMYERIFGDFIVNVARTDTTQSIRKGSPSPHLRFIHNEQSHDDTSNDSDSDGQMFSEHDDKRTVDSDNDEEMSFVDPTSREILHRRMKNHLAEYKRMKSELGLQKEIHCEGFWDPAKSRRASIPSESSNSFSDKVKRFEICVHKRIDSPMIDHKSKSSATPLPIQNVKPQSPSFSLPDQEEIQRFYADCLRTARQSPKRRDVDFRLSDTDSLHTSEFSDASENLSSDSNDVVSGSSIGGIEVGKQRKVEMNISDPDDFRYSRDTGMSNPLMPWFYGL